MGEEETPSIISRKELRKQKLMEYLAAKGKLKLANPKPYLSDNCQVKKPAKSALQVLKSKENNAPVDSLETGAGKVQSLDSSRHPSRKSLVVSNHMNVKDRVLTGRQPANRSATGDTARSTLPKNPVLTGTYTVYSKSNLNTVSHLKKQPDVGMQSSGRASTIEKHTAVKKTNSTFSRRSNTAWSCPVKTFTARISLGPMVKTKTGLTPAVIEPRSTMSNLTHTSAKAADTRTTSAVANKVQSRVLSSLPVSKSSSVAPRKAFPNTAPSNPVHKRTTGSRTGRTGITAQVQNPLLGKPSQPSCRSTLSSRLKSTFTSSKCTAASVKLTNKPAGQPTDRSMKQISEIEGEKNVRKVSSQTTSGPVSRCSTKAVSGRLLPAVAEQGGKPTTCRETERNKGYNSVKAPPPQMGAKRKSAPVTSQSLPRPAGMIRHSAQIKDMKMQNVPVAPHTVGKKLSAAQEERMKKLQEWREAKGISYKRPPMPVKPQVRHTVALPQPFWATMKEEDEAHSFICAVDRSLSDCIKLLGEGCPPEQVKGVLARLPAVSQKFAKYWICKARLMEQEGNLDVLPMFEEAVRIVLEPVDELRTVVFEILKKKDEIRASEETEDQTPVESTPEPPMMTPAKPVRALICGEQGGSSVVKYKITATPGGPSSQQRDLTRVNGQEVRFFTPVRRSVRIERASLRYPASLQDHDLCVASYNDLMAAEDKKIVEEQTGGKSSPSASDEPMYIYRQNEALTDKVFVQLVCDEAAESEGPTSSPSDWN